MGILSLLLALSLNLAVVFFKNEKVDSMLSVILHLLIATTLFFLVHGVLQKRLLNKRLSPKAN